MHDITKAMPDNTFRALAHDQRRTLLLDVLKEHPKYVEVESSASETAQAEAKQRVSVAMYHTHLPKLEEYGFIEWDKDTHEVVKGPRFEEIRPLLECVDNLAETDIEILKTAIEQGYFKVPRQVPLVDIADAHDISDKEASERLRTELDAALREYLGEFDATDATEKE